MASPDLRKIPFQHLLEDLGAGHLPAGRVGRIGLQVLAEMPYGFFFHLFPVEIHRFNPLN